MLPELTGYTWNADAKRYRDDSGKFVSRAAVQEGLENIMDQSALNMNALTQQLIDGKISLASWQSGMLQEIKSVNVAASALANGGWAQMTPSDWGYTGSLIKEQYNYLRNFAEQVASGEQALDGRALVRSDLYGDAANGTYSDMRGRLFIADGYEEEIAVLEPGADHCDGCLERAAEGWQPIGTLSDIGDEDCQARDRCVKRYRRMDENGEWEESE